MLLQCAEKGGGAGEEPLLEGHEHEVSGKPLGMLLSPRLPPGGVLSESGMDSLLLLGVIDLQGFQHPLRETVLAEVVLGEFRLEAPDHDGIPLSHELLGISRHATGEPLVVEQFEQGGEALGIAVVGRGREEEFVLEVGGQQADGLGAERVGGILAPTCGSAEGSGSTG